MMKIGKQSYLFKIQVRKLSTYRCKIPYTDSWINFIEERKKWQLKILIMCINFGNEMLPTDKSKAEKTDME